MIACTLVGCAALMRTNEYECSFNFPKSFFFNPQIYKNHIVSNYKLNMDSEFLPIDFP